MSNRPCNLCQYLRLKAAAEKLGQELKLVPHPTGSFTRGMDAFVDGRFAAWYAEIPEECAC